MGTSSKEEKDDMSLSRHRFWQGCLVIFALFTLLLTCLSPTAKAAEDDVVDLGVVDLTGDVVQGTFQLTPQIMDDLFTMDGSVWPGGYWKRTVHVTNDCSRAMEIAIISCTTDSEETSLFDVLTTEVVVDGEVVYSGPYGAGSEEEPMTELLKIPGGESLDFEITIHLDEYEGNYLQGSPMESTWLFGAYYDYPSSGGGDKVIYTVYYVDEDGNELHEKKVGYARVGSEVTEQAIYIEGYTPDAEEKTIKIKRNPDKNIITFVYTPVEEEVPPPEEPQTPQEPTTPSGVKTGVDLEEGSNATLYTILAILLACIVLAGVILWKLIPMIKKKEEADSSREEDPKS